MSNEKRWSYAQITRKAEEEITRLMNSATDKTDHTDSLIGKSMAYGVYISWYSLTTGWQKDGDDERLRLLTIDEPVQHQ